MNRRTKIVATLGPASWSDENIKQLVTAGVNVFRLNFSHGHPEQHAGHITRIRQLSAKLKQPIGILADLPGPKLRVGEFTDHLPIFLKNKAQVTLTTRKILGTDGEIPIAYSALPKVVAKGDRILLADGRLELRVRKCTATDIFCTVTMGGELKERQGINIPGRRLDIPSFTFRDRRAVEMLKEVQVDFIALSFVQTAQDILKARKELAKLKLDVPIIAKIEKPEALRRIDEILPLVQGIMIARGDLGVEIPTEDVPVIQKQLIRLASKYGIPVITATQMLESMIYNSRPTRAESTDVANAIWDGTDAVMLSGETASGAYPIEAVKTMGRIVERAEAHLDLGWNPQFDSYETAQQEVLQAAASIASPKKHKAIVTFTETGNTPILLSKMRPAVPVIALTPKEVTIHRMSLMWGVRAYYSQTGNSADQMIRNGDKVLLAHAGLKKGDSVILVAGTRLTSGATNMIKVHKVGDVRDIL